MRLKPYKQKKIRDNPNKPFIIPLFIPHLGCGHRCVFCNQHTITGVNNRTSAVDELRRRIAQFLSYRDPKRKPVQISFYGGNFMGLSRVLQETLLKEAHLFIREGRVDSIRLSTRPDTVTEDKLNLLKDFNVTTVELGVQSMNDQVLKLCQRGHTAADTVRAVTLLKEAGFEVGLQIMPGLPDETESVSLETGRRVAKLSPDFVRIYPTLVIKNSLLEDWYYEGLYKPLELREAIEITKRLYLLFISLDIPVIRMGLQPTDELWQKENVIAGPFHPAFGHLVHSAIFLDKATRSIQREKGLPRSITLLVNPAHISRLRGHKNENIKRLKHTFNLEQIQVVADPKVHKGDVEVIIP